MKSTSAAATDGVVADIGGLIRCRPDIKKTGFAPGGPVTTHQFGTNRSVFSGRGMEFDEARMYQPGDDVRSIDWRVTARTGKVHTKLYREERERPVFILIDCRTMMHFGTQVRFKSVLAAQLAAMFSWVGIDGGDRVGGFILTQEGLRSFPATRSRSTMLAFLQAISKATQGIDPALENEIPLSQAIRRLRHVCRPGTLAFIISDYSDIDDICIAEIKRLSVHAHVTNVFTYDQMDAELPRRGDLRVSDGTHVMSLERFGTKLRADHDSEFIARKESIARLSRQRGMAFHAIRTAEEPASILHPHHLLHSAKTSSRKVI